MTKQQQRWASEDRRRVSHETRLERESEATAEEDRVEIGEKKWDGALVWMESEAGWRMGN
jgi:hypothetical protein